MNTFRTFIIIVFIAMVCLLIAGCSAAAETPTATVESPTATAELKPTNTSEPTETATAVPSATFTPEPTATATTLPTNTPTTEPTPTETSTNPSNLSEPFNLDYLVTAPQLNLLTEDIGIIEWQAYGEDLEWENRLCRTFVGVSWSISPNSAINCIFRGGSNVDMDTAIEWLFENDILFDRAFPVEPSMTYNTEYVLYAGFYDNGHSAFDGFLMGDGVLYWVSISVGTPGGYTPEMVFDEYGEEIEALLYEIFMINLAQSEIVDVSEGN